MPRDSQRLPFSMSEQRKRLLQTLGRKGKPAELFLDVIELHVRDFAFWEKCLRAGVLPSGMVTLKNLQAMQRHVTAAHDSLGSLEQGDEYWWLVDHLSAAIPRRILPEDSAPQDEEAEYRAYEADAMRRDALAEKFLAVFVAKLARLRSVIDSGLMRYHKQPRGRPQSLNERRLIQRVATEHLRCFGRLPSSAKEGKFHAFILLLMESAGCPQGDCSRVLKRAIDGL